MAKPKIRQEWILDRLKESRGITYTELCGEYSVEFGKSNRTFDKDWIKAKGEFEIYNEKLQEEKDEIRKENEKNFIRNGLRTKFERIRLLQDLIDEAMAEHKKGTQTEIVKDGDDPVEYERPLTPFEKNALRRTIRQLQAEISKIEGDYAEKKLIHSNDPENPITQNPVIFYIPDNGRGDTYEQLKKENKI